MKCYVTDMMNTLIIDKPNTKDAAKAFVDYWAMRGKSIGPYIKVSERGFEENPGECVLFKKESLA